jgi:hypothetical protein
MKSAKVNKFISLAGQNASKEFIVGTPEQRKLGAQLLLSEVLEYVVHGLGVEPEVNGIRITSPDALHYHNATEPDKLEMVDGLADVAYTMYWNSETFGVPVEAAYDLVCDNNLEKFVKLGSWALGRTALEQGEWDCKLGVTWPKEVVAVEVVQYQGEPFAVGKDARGKVRKPSTYVSVDLTSLCK